jgi:hypothetical protein
MCRLLCRQPLYITYVLEYSLFFWGHIPASAHIEAHAMFTRAKWGHLYYAGPRPVPAHNIYTIHVRELDFNCMQVAIDIFPCIASTLQSYWTRPGIYLKSNNACVLVPTSSSWCTFMLGRYNIVIPSSTYTWNIRLPYRCTIMYILLRIEYEWFSAEADIHIYNNN